MSTAKKKAVSSKAKNRKQSVKQRKDDSKAIERAVYDGMQDLRVKKSR